MTTPTAAPIAEPSIVSTPPVAAFTPLTLADFTLPEGHTLDEKASGTLLEIMNNQELTPAARANALIELQANLTRQSSEAGSLAWAREQQGWKDAVASDPVVGGQNLQKTLDNIGNLMTRFGNDEVRAAFDKTGAGNNPAVVKFLNTVAQQLGESVIVPPGGPANQQPASIADRIFAKPN